MNPGLKARVKEVRDGVSTPALFPVGKYPGLFGGRMPEKFVSPVGCQGQEPLEKAEVSLTSMMEGLCRACAWPPSSGAPQAKQNLVTLNP